MPYSKTSELPPRVKDNLPAHAQEIFMAAYNSAFEKHGKEEYADVTCNSIAWAAVKNKYKKGDGDTWVAKEAVNLSVENKRLLLVVAIRARLGGDNSPGCNGLYVEDMTDTEAFYQQEGETFAIPYTMSDLGEVMLGEPKQVVRQVVYTTAEAVHQSYADLVALCGVRGTADWELNKEIHEVSNMLKIMDTETTEIGYPDKVLNRITEIATKVKTFEAVKTEDGSEYPSSAFAYVPDAEKPSTWKMRLWEDPTKKVTRSQLGREAAALSPGGFRGQKADIPSEDLGMVKRNIRSAYRGLDISEEEMPKWIKETEMRTAINEVLREATAPIKGRGLLTIIKKGFNETKGRFYPPETLARDYKIFEGNKMYADHDTEEEQSARPERSIKDWVATLENVKVRASDGALVGNYTVIEPWFEAKLAKLRDAGQLDKIGVSINAIGSATRQKVDGVETNFIERLVASRSVDFVTEPGAGGRVEIFEAKDPMLDVDLVDLISFKERRPDIVKLIEEGVRAEIIQEGKRKMELEQENQTLKESNTHLTEENTQLKGQIAEADKAKVKAEAQAKIKEAVDKAELPEAAKARLLESFKSAETEAGVTEAIKAEIAYIATLAEAGKVKGMGDTAPDATEKKANDELKESFKAGYKTQGKSDAEAEKLAVISAAGR